MTNLAALQDAVANASVAGVASRVREAKLRQVAYNLLAKHALERLPEAVEMAVRMQSWAILMELSFSDFPSTYRIGSRQLTAEQLVGAGKQVFEVCKELGLNPKIEFGSSYRAYITITPESSNQKDKTIQ